jgi:hypothetical protein
MKGESDLLRPSPRTKFIMYRTTGTFNVKRNSLDTQHWIQKEKNKIKERK